MNLLEETMNAIVESGHKIEDIVFIGSESSGHSCTWDEFIALADVEYDNGYGAQEVARDLIIVFSDGTRMWRGEYDGAEWWEYFPSFIMPKKKKRRITRLLTKNIGWDNLAEINGDKDDT